MRKILPVTISEGGFTTCKYSVAIILVLAIFAPMVLPVAGLRIGLVALSFGILAVSALVGVAKAPMVVAFDLTLGRLIKTKPVMLDGRGMRFAHTLGAVLNGTTLLFLLLLPKVGFVLLVITAGLKCVSAVGFCGGLKLYQCMNNDDCCKVIKGI